MTAEIATSHMALESGPGALWLEEDELTFPSYPRRFYSNPELADLNNCTSMSNAPSEIESLLDKDDSLSTNTDFWREVPVSCEHDEPVAPQNSALDLSHNDFDLESPLKSPVVSSAASAEPRLEDFFQDLETTNPASQQTLFQSDFQFKRLCFRDADGKLALTDAQSSYHISKPMHKNVTYNTSKGLLKRALRRKSGFWEMASPSFAVAEFMLM
ncbi:LANO_0G10440g1_1 [Lachancea nothofagi CBS 11611]|uniref:LANO_0G10440g1_1 n=1 Tax=Lachancea nothofagi CBS 11611 TaxID=1266666 RepID=A0A1G4KJ76_9SACH|nr:LANO_0G10440g1_1 [Lachancea nothofagi CBS 11611]